VDPHALLNEVAGRLRALAAAAVDDLVRLLPQLGDEPSVTGIPELAGRLLTVHDRLPPGNSLVELVREVLGDLGAGSPVRLHGWRRAPGALGVALVATNPVAGVTAGRAVLGVTPAPGGPVFDVVLTRDANVVIPQQQTGPWTATAGMTSPGWNTAFGPGSAPVPPLGAVQITLQRSGELAVGMADGPGLSVAGVGITIAVGTGSPATCAVELRSLRAAILPAALAKLVGVRAGSAMAGGDDKGATVVLNADRAGGLRFAGSAALRVEIPLRVDAPGVQSRGVAVTLGVEGGDLRLGLSLSLTASLPGLPVRAAIDGTGIDLPVVLDPRTRIGLDPSKLRERFPDGIGTDLNLPPVSGGGTINHLPDDTYAGLIALRLGVLRLMAFAVFRPPGRGPTTFLVLLAATFPPPGLQVGLGFAIDGVGGLVGVNRRVDVSALERLVREGNTDRVLFPDDPGGAAAAIIAALTSAFPERAGRMLIGPMVRLNWGGRIVTLSGSLVLEVPAPVTAVLLGRLVVALPDPAVPLIRLQAGVLGQIDPGIPKIEVLVSLAGSWVVGLAVRGEMYLLVRGGAQPEFVLSAGGFHPRYTRPPGVPDLERLQIDLAPGGGYGLRMEAYFAVTSNAVMFGGEVRLVAMIAGCGVEGWLGLDTLFVFDPVFAFSARVRAGVAVRAFGKRLAGVALDFTLEGPAPWHAFGTGSVSVLFWDASLDFDVRWGSPPAVGAVRGRDPLDPLRTAIARVETWTAERPAAERTALVFTRDAQKRLATGALVHPDATLRMSQKVLPLGVVFTKFERRPVPRQKWTVAAVTVGAPQPADVLSSLSERFVPGEFFDLNDDQQLTARAFDTYAGGVRVDVDGVSVTPGHRVVDGYETAYEPERGRETRGWRGIFAREAVFGMGADARLERWRAATVVSGVPVQVRRATLSVADATSLRPLAEDVTLVNATADAWLAVRDQLPDPAAPVQLVETWELQP